MRHLWLVTLLGCGPPPVPPDDGVYRYNWYVDPVSGSDANDGSSEATPFRTLLPFSPAGADGKDIYPEPDTRIAIKRGTVLRLDETVALRGGTKKGWVAWSAYGPPTDPKPILAGSVPIGSSDWSDLGNGLLELGWSDHVDTGEDRSADGVEQGPGNLWFFDSDTSSAEMTSWGWRQPSRVTADNEVGDWSYDPKARSIRLRWTGPAPAITEAAVSRTMMTFAGQSYLIVEDLDLRYGGAYVARGHEVKHLRLRRLDMSFSGGGTKNGEYVRLGNGIETNGDAEHVLVEQCRFHQLYDTGFDPQNTGSKPVTQSDLTFRNNLVSYAGLASFELWLRPDRSVLSRVAVENNTFLHAGGGWGFEQHEPDNQIGGDVVIFANEADGEGIEIRRNVFFDPVLFVMSEFRDDQPATQALVRGLTMDDNLWSPGPSTRFGAILWKGTEASSTTFADLAAWQRSSEVPGHDESSDEADPEFADPADPAIQDLAWITSLPPGQRPTRFGPWALRGDYSRPASEQDGRGRLPARSEEP